MAASRNKRSSDLPSRLRLRLKERLGEWLGDAQLASSQLVVAFSGGRDSAALLHALAVLRAEAGFALSALHVHHGLSPDADRWVAFAENFCKSLDVPLQVERVSVPADSGSGIEGAARAERYRVFARTRADILLLAHHQDDQAETLLFNLLRGAGVQGAAAMPARRLLARPERVGGGRLLLGRPWLDVSRAEIDRYVLAAGVPHIEDESNADPAYSRNHLRHQILPRLSERYPQASLSLAEAARRFGDAAQLLDVLADLDLASLEHPEGLAIDGLRRLDEARQKNVLRRWLAKRGVRLASDAGLAEFLRQCREASAGATVCGVFGAYRLRRWQGKIYCLAEHLPVAMAAQVWNGAPSLEWCGGEVRLGPVAGTADISGLRLSAAALQGRVEIRVRQGSEAMRLRHGGPSRPLRLLFQEHGVPPWERSRVPLLWVDGQLAAVGGIGVAAGFAAVCCEPAVVFEWRPVIESAAAD